MTGTYLYETQDIARRTGVDVNRIRHLATKLSDILDPYRMRGMSGVYQYDSGGLALWDRIIQLSNEGYGPQAIHKNLSIALKTAETETGLEASQPSSSERQREEPTRHQESTSVATLYETMLTHMKEAHASIIVEKDRAIQRLEEDRTRFLLGPGDRARLDRLLQDQKKRIQLLKDLSESSIFQVGKRRRIESQLLDIEIGAGEKC